MAITIGILVLFGLVAGSFGSVLIKRLPQGKEWKWTRSACPNCNHSLRWADLVPIISFALLQGRCRYCHTPFGFRYVILEVVCAISFGILGFLLWPQIVMRPTVGFLTLMWLIIVVFLGVVLFVIDLEHMILPDGLIFVGIVVTLIYRLGMAFLKLYPVSEYAWMVVGASGAALLFYCLILLTKGKGMGLGDVKLVFFLGLVTGWPAIVAALFISFLSGAFVSLGLVLARKKTIKDTIPFGPFLLTGAAASFVVGSKFFAWIGYS